jgi:hypothetical protein
MQAALICYGCTAVQYSVLHRGPKKGEITTHSIASARVFERKESY